MNLTTITTYSKAEAEKLALVTINQIAEGTRSATDVLAECTYIEVALSQIEEMAKPIAVEEVQRTGTATIKGVKLEVVEAGVKYDYSHDAIWQGLQDQIEQLKEAQKQHENLLKTVPDALSGKALIEATNPDTGEVYTLRRPAKSSTTTIKATLNKC